MVFDVFSRGVGRTRLFLKDPTFEAFERIIDRYKSFPVEKWS